MISTGRSAGVVRSLIALALVSCTWVLAAGSDAACANDITAPLRRAIVPAEAQERWPAGEWVRLPYAEVVAFARDFENGELAHHGPPLIDRLVLRASLAEGTLIEGRFEAQVRRLEPEASFLDLGRPTGSLRNLQWADSPAVWGTAPDARTLLQVDRPAGTLTGEWSQRGESSPVGSEFDLRTFPAASIRLEVALPADYELHATRGVVLPPGADGTADGVWSVELGQQAGCLCTVVRRSDRPPIVAMSVERTASWTIRPDGCRLHADFNISIPATAPATLEFEIPSGLENAEATTSANVGLPVEIDRRSMPPRLIVPLPRLTAGRLGMIRVSGDLPRHDHDDWKLPDVHLENSTVVSSLRRIHVDRPLKLLSFELDGARQSGINVDEAGGDWTFEDTAPDASVTVRVGQPPAALVVRAVTLVELSRNEARFRTAAELRSRGGGEYLAQLQLPADWNVIEVGPAAGDRAGITSWRATESSSGVRLEIEFRQALSAQSSRHVLISGRRVGPSATSRDVELFPQLTSQDEVRSWLGIRGDASAAGTLTPHNGAQRFVAADGPAEWDRLITLLGVEETDPDWSWFVQAEPGADGSVGIATQTTASQDLRVPTSAASSSDAGPDPGPFSMDLLLDTDLGGPHSDWLRHRANYSLSGRLPDHPPQIRLPGGARLDEVAIDGRPQNVVVAGDVIELLEWPGSPRSVVVRYSTRNSGQHRWLTRDVAFPLPEWSTPPRTVEWRLHLSSAEGLADVQVPRSAVLPRPGNDWLHRAFGPLARDDWRQTANPFSMDAWLRRIMATPRSSAPRDRTISICTSAPHGALSVELADLQNVQRAGWLALLGAALAAGVLRLCWRRGAGIVWLAILCLLIAASVLPVVSATVCGAALAGALIGGLLPRRWIEPALGKRVPAAMTTAMQRAGAAIGAGLLLVNLWETRLQAQPAPPEPERSASGAPPAPVEFDVLLPEVAGATADHAFIERRLSTQFERWRRTRHNDPPSLLQSAHYALEFGDVTRVRARFHVAVIDRHIPVPLVLPFGRVWVQDPDACTVDGRPAQIRPAASPDVLLVELHPTGTDAGASAQFSEIELTLRLSAEAQTDSGWQFEVPGVLDTQLSLPVVAPNDRLTADGHHASRSEDDGRTVIELGGRTTIAVRREGSPAPSAAQALSAEAVSLIEVHPLRLRVRTSLFTSAQARAQMPAGPQRLRLHLPARSDVREVAVTGLQSYAVQHPRRDLTLVDLELERIPEPGAGIHLDFTIPVETPGEATRIPPLAFLGEGRLRSHRVGLRASPGFVLDLPSPAGLPAALSEIPAAMFSAGLDTGTAWPVPSHAYVTAAPAELTVVSRPAAPRKSVVLKQSLAIGGESLQWTATAEVDVADVPAYRHVFQLSAAVQLNGVQLVQDDVPRLLDWSHDDDRLVLYLAGDRIGKQQVRLSGAMKFDAAAVTPFPEFGLPAATLTSSELIVRSTPARPIVLFDGNGNPIPVERGLATGGAVQFSQPDAELPEAFRFLPEPAPLNLSVVTTFDRHDGRSQMLTEVMPERALAPSESIRVDVPAASIESLTPIPPATITRAADGSLRLAGDIQDLEHATGPLAFRMPLDAPEQGDWQAPRVRFPSATVTDEVTVVSSVFPFTPTPAAATTAAPATWPAVLRARRLQDNADAPEAVYRWTGNEARFERRGAGGGTPDVRLIESTVWRGADGALGGETSFWLIAHQQRCDLRFDWPSGAQFRAATWDARSVEPLQAAADRLELRIDGLRPGSVHCLQLAWDAESGASGTIREPAWPHVTNAPRFAVLLPREGYILWPPSGQPARADSLNRRADALLELYAQAGPATDVQSRATIAQEIEAALNTLAEQSSSGTNGLRSRWDDLRSTVPLEPQATAANPAAAGLMAAAWGDSRALPLQLTADSSPIRFWELHAGMTAAAACVAGLLAVTLGLRFRRKIVGLAGQLTVDPDAVRVLALGTLWWTWLKFGILGLLLIGSSAWLQRRARWRVATQTPDSTG